MENTGTETESLHENQMLKKVHWLKQEISKEKLLHEQNTQKNLNLKNELMALKNKLMKNETVLMQEIRERQTEIVHHLKEKREYMKHRTIHDDLREKIEALEKMVKVDQSFYENEIQKVVNETAFEIEDIYSSAKAKVEEQLREAEQKFNNLSIKKEELENQIQTLENDAQKDSALLELEHESQLLRLNEMKSALESQNKMMLESLQRQQKFYNQKIQNLQDRNLLHMDRQENPPSNEFTVLQSLEEAFANSLYQDNSEQLLDDSDPRNINNSS